MHVRVILILLMLLASRIAGAQTKSVSVSNAGTLYSYFTTSELSTTNTLSVSGNVDARDFAFIRDKITNLSILNLSSASIKSYSGSDGTYADTLITYPANELPQYALYNPRLLAYKSTLTSISFPSSITSIGKYALYYCWSLTALSFPSKLTNLGKLAIYGCYALKNIAVVTGNIRFSSSGGVLFNKAQDTIFQVPNNLSGSYTIPSTVKHIASSAFENCYSLTSISIPASVLSIGSYAFSYCSGISGDLTLPAYLKTIDDGAFYGCSNLTGTVSIPASVSDIGFYAFFKSNNIKSFSVNSSNKYYTAQNDILYSKNLDTLFICPATKTGEITIPATVRLIGSYAFYNCSKITGIIEVPSLVDYIGYYAFYGCSSVSEYSVDIKNLYFTSFDGLLYSYDVKRLVVCPAQKTGSISLLTRIESIDPGAFSNCSQLTGNINLPAKVSSIGSYAFFNCTSISGFTVDPGNTSFSASNGVLFNKNADTLLIHPFSKSGIYKMPSTVKTIGPMAFEGCTSLSGVEFSANLNVIGTYAFSGCTGIKTLMLPKVSLIQSGAFYNCTGLQEIGIDKSTPPVIDYYCLKNVDIQQCKLFVPIGSSATYRLAPYWNQFSGIEEIKFNTGVAETNKLKISIFSSEDQIIINNLPPGKQVDIFNLQGNRIFSGYSESSQFKIPFLYKGIFILKIGDLTEKIIL